jgi:hypothetical protein
MCYIESISLMRLVACDNSLVFGRKGLKLARERIVKLVETDSAAAEVEAADHCGVGRDADKLLLGFRYDLTVTMAQHRTARTNSWRSNSNSREVAFSAYERPPAKM